MKLANLATLSSSSALKKHQRRYPAAFEKIITEHGQIRRFYSDEPALLKGLGVFQALRPDSLTMYLEQYAPDQWYGCLLSEQGVEAEKVGSLSLLLETFKYELHQCPALYVTHPIGEDIELNPALREQLEHIEAISDLGPHCVLKKNKPYAGYALGAAVALGFTALLGHHLMSVPPEPKTVMVPSPYQLWERAYFDALSVSSNLTLAKTLLLETRFLPEGFTSGGVTLFDDRLVLPIQQKEWQSVTPLLDWLDAKPELKRYFEPSSLSFVVPAHHKRQPEVVDITHYQSALAQQLALLGHLTLTGEQSIRHISQRDLAFGLSNSVSEYALLTEIMDSPALSLTQLSLQLTPNHQLTGAIQFTLDGYVSND